MKKLYYFISKVFLIVTLFFSYDLKAQTVKMQNGSVHTCNGTFTDDDLGFFNYGNSKDYMLTLYPAPGQTLKITFDFFDVKYGDFLKVYEGNNTGAPLIGDYSDHIKPTTITSMATDGSLTFVFHSDDFANGAGWSAQISCTTKKSRYFVTTTGNGNGSGWNNAGNLTAALADAQDGDEIWVGAGTYNGSFDNQGKDLKLYGGFQPELAPTSLIGRNPGYYSTLNATPNNRVLRIGNNFTIDGFIIQGGSTQAEEGGGGMYIDGIGTTNINNCKFFNNYAFYSGGAISIGDMGNASRKIIINRSIFAGNKADKNGGAIYRSVLGNINRTSDLYIYNSVLQGNAATGNNENALSDNDFLTKLLNMIGGGIGGAIFGLNFINNTPTTEITNCTIAGNFALKQGGVILTYGSSNSKINNSIIANNSNDYYYSPGANPQTMEFNYTGTNNILGGDPKFETPISPTLAPTTAGSYILNNCSPAINAGNNTLYPSSIVGYEATGNERFYGQIDIGAYEYQGTPNNTDNILYVDVNSTYGQGNADVGTAGNKAINNLALALYYASERGCTSEIRVAQGTYYPNLIDRSGFFWSRNGYFNIRGGYPTGFSGSRDPSQYQTIISGDIQKDGVGTNNGYHLMVLTSAQPQLYGNIIDGFTFENAYADNNIPYNDPDFSTPFPQNEGAITYINNMSPTFQNCIFKQSYATVAGGAIVVNNGNPIFENCRFEGNTAGTGGAIKINNQSKVVFRDCNFTTNTANISHGGAVIADQNSNVSFVNTTFNSNVAQYGDGGAIHLQNGGSLTLEKSIFKNNAAKYGGVVRLVIGNINFNANANVFTDNIAHENGAGALSIIPGNGKTVITNNVFTGNKTALGVDNQPSGGASIVQEGGSATYVINNTFFNEKAYAGSSSVHFKSGGSERYLQNNIFYQNTSTAGGNLPNWNLGSSTTAASSNNLENINPMFINASDPDGADNIWGTADDGLRLLSSSPAINQGIATNVAANDILGAARLQDGAIDLGAYEMAPTVLPVNLSSFTAKLENNTAVLRWETYSEKNNDTFEIFRSADAKTYTSLGTVNGKETTSTKNNYTFADRKPLNGINYYKLVQKDVDGKTEELGIRPLTFSFNGEEVLLYPNPVKEKANVRFTAGSYNNITLSDISGKTLQTLKLNKLETEKAIAMNNLANGTYFLRLQGDSKNATVKIIKN